MDAPLADRSVLVTGATGFIGSRLAERLSGDGARVVGVGRRLERVEHLRDRGVELLELDLVRASESALREAAEGCDVVFHAAASLGTDPQVAEATNVKATGALARAGADGGARRFVHVSTVGVYAMGGREVVTEETPLAVDHRATYPRTKARAEVLLREVEEETDLEVVVARPSMVYGPGHGLWTVQMAGNVCRGEPVYLGDGRYGFNPVFLDDVVEALLLCATSEAAAGEAFNVSADVTTWRDFMGRYESLCGRAPKGMPVWLAKLMAAANRIPGVSTPIDSGFVEMATSRKRFPVDKARERLGWEPTTSLDEGMERTLAWLRQSGVVGSEST